MASDGLLLLFIDMQLPVSGLASDRVALFSFTAPRPPLFSFTAPRPPLFSFTGAALPERGVHRAAAADGRPQAARTFHGLSRASR